MKLSKDLREFVELLNSMGVQYLIVGGHAVAYHARPRFTGDIDFFVERSPANAARLRKVLEAFGFGELGLTEEDFLTPSQVIQLGRPPQRIDLLTSIDGVEFEPAWRQRETAELDGIRVFLIGRDDLIRNKRATGRAQDLADLEHLEGPHSTT